jgi:hypothetical protein
MCFKFFWFKKCENCRLQDFSMMLSYGSKAWTVHKRDERIIMAAELKFMRQPAGFSHLD